MRYQIWPILFLMTLPGHGRAAHEELTSPSFPWPKLTPASIESLQKGNFVVQSDVASAKTDKTNRQSLDFYTAGLHPRACVFAMRKLSRYELYTQWLDFVKEASYNEDTQRVRFLLNHALLPFKMQIDFKLPRIKGAGTYHYSFDRGFVAGLSGDIQLIEDASVPEKDRRCLFYATAKWEGPHTGIPNSVFEVFSTTLTRVAMEKLFRLSSVGP